MQLVVAIHLVTGLIGILAGFVTVLVACGRRRAAAAWHNAFLAGTLVADVTGFYFLPIYGITSAQIVGFLSVIALVLGCYCRFAKHLGGASNRIYLVTVMTSLFLNVLIAVTQSFEHFRWLKKIAPAQSGPVFVFIKVGLLIGFIAIGFLAITRAASDISAPQRRLPGDPADRPDRA